MIFADFPLDQAAGALLAHTHRLAERVLKKGLVLDDAAIGMLRRAGRDSVIAVRLEPGDVPENEAADRLARAVLAPSMSHRRAMTGRCNLHSDAAGLLRVDAALIDQINLLDESLTIATLPDYAVVAAGDMLATLKVIPFAVAGAVLQRAEALARSQPPLHLHRFRPLHVGLVLSELPGLKQEVIDGTIAATETRITGLGGKMLPALRCPHSQAAIAAALGQLRRAGAELLLVAGASATVDRNDVGPAALVAAGGEILHFGMPVDPGNLICLGRIGAVPALILPGCARSPRPNGIDLVLHRIFAGLALGGSDMMRMGVGGLLKDTAARPLPRARAVAGPAAEPAHSVAAVVLAAGKSSRMAPYNKLLIADRGGKPMIARVIDNLLSSAARPIVVVTGHIAADIRAAIGGRPVSFVHAAEYDSGLSASLKAGIAAVPPEASAAIVCLGDMPLVTGRIIDRLIACYDADEGRSIVVPTHQGKPGNPILWDRRYFAEILALSGDSGARALLGRHAEEVAEIDIGEDAILRDFDTVDSLATLPPRLRPADLR